MQAVALTIQLAVRGREQVVHGDEVDFVVSCHSLH